MKETLSKRILSLALCIVMVLGLLPMTAFAEDTVEYNLWVGGVQFTSANLEIDSTDNADISGTATYVPESNLLTLNGFTYTGTGDEFNSAVVFGVDSFEIQLVGTNKLENTSQFGYGLCGAAYTDITISGNGSLDITGVGNYGISTGGTVNISSNVSVTNDEYGISADQVHISGGTVSITVNGECAGIETVYDTEISGGSVTIYSRYGNGITSDYGNVLMSDATVNIEAGYHGIYADSGVSMEDCDKVTIKANDESGVYSKDTVDITNCSKVEIQVTYKYGIYARDDVAISNSGVNITSGNHGIYTATKEDAEVHIKEKSVVTIDAGKNGIRTAKEDCPVTISASTVSITNSNYGIYTKDDDSPVTIENGSIVTISSRCYGVYARDSSISVAGSAVTVQGDEDGAFDSEPTVTDYDAAHIWYGDTESEALAADAQDISELAEHYSQKYVKIAPIYTVSFDSNGGGVHDSVTVVYGDTYGTLLPSSSITGLSGDWYLLDKNGSVTETIITKDSIVNTNRDHMLRMVRRIAVPSLELKLTAPGCLSDAYGYYNPEDSTRILTVTVNGTNEDILSYTYQWYKDGELISGESRSVLTLEGNVSDSGTYTVVVTATLKDGTGITVTENSASQECEQKVTIRHAANVLYYLANGGTGGASSNSTGGTTATVSKNVPQREGYTFTGWNTEADGSGDRYSAGSTYTFANDNGNGGCKVTLYAQWTINTYTVTVVNGEGYTITVDKTEFEYNGSFTIALTIADGYSKTEQFGVWLNGNKMNWGDQNEAEVMQCREDVEITVTGVADITAPTLEGIENGGIYYGELLVIQPVDQLNDIARVTLDGEPMGFEEGLYGLIPADNKEHIVIVTDKAGNATEYKVTVYKNYTVTYKVDGEVIGADTVGYGMDADLPDIPVKEGYDQTAPVWDHDGKSIIADTEINAVYTINEYTVTFQNGDDTVETESVKHGEDVELPAVAKKDGFVGRWDHDGKDITADTEINAVYTAVSGIVHEDLKLEDKTNLEDAKKTLEEELEDDCYTDEEKKAIRDAIDDINDALEIIKNVEAVEELIDKLPETITKDDEAAIKAADDALGALSDYEKSLVDENAKKALNEAKAALAELNKPADTSPNTGDNSQMALWIVLLFVSGGAIITLTAVGRKRKVAAKR